MTPSEQTQRIQDMERILDAHTAKIAALQSALQEFTNGQDDYNRLKEYYVSEAYQQDVAASEHGDLPTDLKCGVLTQDAIYDLIGDNFHTAISMLEDATAIIKAH